MLLRPARLCSFVVMLAVGMVLIGKAACEGGWTAAAHP